MRISKQPGILILTGQYGDGHRQAALAIQEACRLAKPQTDAIVVDFMEWMHPRFNAIGKTLFIHGVQKFPGFYGFLFEKTRRPNPLSQKVSRWLTLGIGKMRKLLRETEPAVVVSTFPLAAAAMSFLKERGLADVPTVTVITDHTDHSYWIHPYTDQYIVGSDRVRDSLLALGIPRDSIAVTGIPIRPEFAAPCDKKVLLRKHGLDPSLPTVLLMGGGYGMFDKDLFRLLKGDSLSRRMQFIIVCGRNRKLLDQLSAELEHSKHRIVLTGFVPHIHEFMALSDMMITKPGGLTTSEAIAMQLPMLLYRPLPGQEEDNAAFLTEAGVAVRAEGGADLIAKLEMLAGHPDLLDRMRLCASRFEMQEAAARAVEEIWRARSAFVPAFAKARFAGVVTGG